MYDFTEDEPIISKKYRDWVETLPCARCGNASSERIIHHIMGLMYKKISEPCDLLSMSLCTTDLNCNSIVHESSEIGAYAREQQGMWIALTLQKAIKDGIIFDLAEPYGE